MTSEKFCILLRNCVGKKKEKGLIKSTTSKVDILPGSLLLFIFNDTDHSSNQNICVLETLDPENIEVKCNNEDFDGISKEEYEVLVSIPTCNERMTIYLDKHWLQEGLELNVNDYVYVYDKASSKDLIGIIRYKGAIVDLKGIFFGVEYIYDIGKGISDGVFRKQRYFTCAPNCAAFVALHRIRKCSKPLPTEEAVELVGATNFTNKWNLKIKDRVVWYSDDGPEYGTVKWIGLLPDTRSNEDVTVGVEFDNPVGSGTGKYKDHRLFTAKQNHASLVPIIGLLKAEDISPEYLPENLAPKETLIQNSSNSRKIPNNSSQQDTQHDPDLTVGSLVEVMSNRPLYGVIKWIGNLPDQKKPQKLIAGLEMEDEIAAGTDGTFKQHRLFTCPPKKGFFVPLYKCRKDKRFFDDRANQNPSDRSLYFGSNETPDLEGSVSPPSSLHDVASFCGKGKGIQGHHNSCYMDATLLAMFYFTTVFDTILHRPKNAQDIPEYGEVQQVLKEGIVNPLRKHHYVRADKVMKLRRLLDKVGKIPGMMSEEKDPEEFLNLLFNEITQADPFLKICTENRISETDTQHTYFYQLIMEKDERLVLPTTQQLFELSFLQMGIKLKEIPSCLIIQMPRFGKDYKMYKRILPSLELDITDVLENSPRECIICGELAAFECKECYQVHGAGLNTIAFCDGCKQTSHRHKLRVNHKCRMINTPQWYREQYIAHKTQQKRQPIQREKMELFAVICIQTSHYVSFVKTGSGKKAKWIFFDSMADRRGEQSGYNIPEVQECCEIPLWLSDEHFSDIMKNPDDKNLPEHIRRLICDAYICMYQSPTVMKFN
ncbi:ubiquitin carboxyl-terminal hydrolase CYLD-like isoform X2 [Dreissena polymorpha]|uniref:ubiquitin carboxyl-terminal hydrolase CYLD-like isoform X2 n=1 Tax=Dreissena polymorpha TaxID=45954 RepID=UPI002264D1E7|nr:ubiquitin carboxyl-terminal hydrolase CYLD-like isoform X2 [Dreissena polymorpha]